MAQKYLPTERSKQIASFLEKTQAARGRLIIGLDATMSRQPTWDAAVELQASMFAETAKLGGLEVQLVFFRGSECQASDWTSNANGLAGRMRTISCVGGTTQWLKVFKHVHREHRQKPISVGIAIGDCCEEQPGALYDAAVGLPRLFIFQEGDDPAASVVFPELARRTGGAHFKLGLDSARELGELLRGVAVFAAGGQAALERLGTDSARKLLTQLNDPSSRL
jgi:hypothetical protein